MCDMAGIDIGFSVRRELGLVSSESLAGAAGGGGGGRGGGGGAIVSPYRYSTIADELFFCGRLGVKVGRGFYSYGRKMERRWGFQFCVRSFLLLQSVLLFFFSARKSCSYILLFL